MLLQLAQLIVFSENQIGKGLTGSQILDRYLVDYERISQVF